MNALLNSIRMLFGKRPRSLQVGAICRDSGTGEVLLITSRGTGRWVIPKGWPMAGRSLAGAANGEELPNFDRILEEATALLTGVKRSDGVRGDEAR